MAKKGEFPAALIGSVTGKPRTAAQKKTSKKWLNRIQKPAKRAVEPLSPQRQLLTLAKNKFVKEFLGGEKEWVKSHDRGRKGKTLGMENIVGVSIDHKYINGVATPQLVLKIMVKKKDELRGVRSEFRIPETIKVKGKDVLTDVVEVGNILPQSIPTHCGQITKLGNVNMVGTIACLCAVADGTSLGTLCFLSNNHVLGNVDRAIAAKKHGFVGEAVNQADAVTNGDGEFLGRLWDFVELGNAATVDVAAAATTPDLVDPLIVDFVGNQGSITIRDAHFRVREGDRVSKIGGFSGFTMGKVVNPSAHFVMGYGRPDAFGQATAPFVSLSDLIEIQPSSSAAFFRIPGDVNSMFFSAPGDSGSLIVDTETNTPVGLHFAGPNPENAPPGLHSSFACHIDNVVEQLGIIRFLP